MTSLGLPFQGSLWYYVESAYGTATYTSGTLAVSAKVLDAKVSISDRQKKLRGFDSPNCCNLLAQCKDYSFHVEYIPQVGDTLLGNCVLRSAGALQSLQFCLGTNVAKGSDQTYYLVTGCKAKTIKIAASKNNEYIVTVDFDAKSAPTSATKTGKAPTVMAGAYCAFNIAGSITKGAVDFAYITNSIDITIDNGVKSHFDHDSVDKQYCLEGELNVDGTVDISLDEGGGKHLAEVVNLLDFTLILNLGAATAPKITISNCEFKNAGIDVNISGDAMMESCPLVAKSVVIGTV